MKKYRSVHKSVPFSFIINKSEFIGNCKFVETEEEALEFVDSIKSKYSDATHNCSAYVIREDKLTQRFDDDGEPSQTAGIPIFEVIKKKI